MNQTAEECRDPLAPSSSSASVVKGHRLSLTDLFCTEPFPTSSPNSVSIAVAAAAAAAAASGLEGFRLPHSSPPHGLFISPTNPFYDDLIPEESFQLAQPYLHQQFQWKHSQQPKYRVNDYLPCHPNVSFTRQMESSICSLSCLSFNVVTWIFSTV